MIKNITLIGLLFCGSLTAADVDHFKGQASPDLKSALCNLQKFDAKLKARTYKSDISLEDLAEVHQLTYTLEVAIQRIQQDLVTTAEELEKVHKASERAAFYEVKASATKYLAATSLLTQGVSCK